MPFRKERGGTLQTSEGLGFPDAEGERARWIALSMALSGRGNPAGVAILDHPYNPEHPVPWRVDGQLGISPSRCVAGAWRLAEGETTTSRYRVFIFRGDIDKPAIEAQWDAFTNLR